MPLWYAEAADRDKRRDLLNQNIPDLDDLAKSVPGEAGRNREENEPKERAIH
jgi:hypothetical protein